jgi:hypothetical protein
LRTHGRGLTAAITLTIAAKPTQVFEEIHSGHKDHSRGNMSIMAMQINVRPNESLPFTAIIHRQHDEEFAAATPLSDPGCYTFV